MILVSTVYDPIWIHIGAFTSEICPISVDVIVKTKIHDVLVIWFWILMGSDPDRGCIRISLFSIVFPLCCWVPIEYFFYEKLDTCFYFSYFCIVIKIYSYE